ncbi:MAG: Pls/PosA family non-ribosomal peptide synthetase [Caulobacterales bacterium]
MNLAVATAPTPESREVGAAPAPFERDELLHEVFAQSAAEFADRIAVRQALPDPESPRRDCYTYAELRHRASSFARYLRGRGVRRGDRVLIWLPRGFDQYMALLGALEAGAAYVPIDWSAPADRVLYIAEESEAFAVITTTERSQGFPANVQCIVPVDLDLGDIAAEATTPLARDDTGATPDDIAYIIYTSGSTGRPKGVMIRHRNVCFQIRSEGSVLKLTPDDRVFAGASLSFDISVEEMWGAFLAGAELIIPTDTLMRSGPDLGVALAELGVTVWCPVPSLLSVVGDDIPSLRILNAGGEACPLDLVRRWARPGLRFLNTYGPTETTVTATWSELHPDRPVTIGKPLPGFSTWVLDASLRRVDDGVEGELVIGGPAVGAGYLHREELTAQKFIEPPWLIAEGRPEVAYRTGDLVRVNADGDIEFLGRIDTQVKIRGYRVELGEIESVLAEDPAIAHAVVNLYPEDGGGEFLAAFLAPRRGQAPDVDRLKETLRQRLPTYMHPQAFQVVDSFPTLMSGKVDRKALQRPTPAPVEERTVEPPATPLEAALLEIWRATFGLHTISVTDDFFQDLEGHSLRAARMVSMARANPELAAISIQDLYEAPNIRALAAVLQAANEQPHAEAAPLPPFEPIPRLRRFLCVAAQTVALVPIYSLSGVQWLLPYLVYVHNVSPEPETRLPALAWAAATFLVMPPVIIAFSILVKWAVIGRYRAGDYPLWGLYFFRWWLVRRVQDVIPTEFLSGTPMMALYYRLQGARVGKDAVLNFLDMDAPDLVSIGDRAVISEGAMMATTAVEHGRLRIGPVDIGADARMGTASVLGRGSRIGPGSVLEDLSAIGPGQSIAGGELWSGSPAVRIGPAPERPQSTPPSALRRFLVTLGLVVVAPLLPLAAILPIAPGLVAMIELDWATDDKGYIALSPFLAVVYVIAMCLLIVVAKWLLLGRVKPGVYSMWSWFYIRFWFVQQLGALALDLIHSIYATLYVAPWYRALGAKVGRRAEISTATSVMHDLIDIGPESFIADGVSFGGARFDVGSFRLERTRIGRRTFLGNSAVLPTGSNLGDEVLIGVLSKPPPDREAEAGGTSWFGCPAIRLPRRQMVAMFDEGARFNPSKRLIATRLAIEFVRITLPLTVFVAMFSVFLSIIGYLDDQADADLLIPLLFPPLYLAFVFCAGLFTLALKWVVIGRYKPTTAPLWSIFVWRTELVTSTYENLAVPLLLEPLRGTPYLNICLRLMGCRIGKRVYCDTTDITEHDLVDVGDDAALNDGAGIQTHLFEDRVMKVSSVKIGERATVGSLSITLYDSIIEPDAMLGDLSVLMKGEVLPAGTSWEGSPARPAAQ